MPYDPNTDVDEGYDVEGHAATQDQLDQLEQQQTATPALRPTAPGVYSPTPAAPTQQQGITPPAPPRRTNRPPEDDQFERGAEFAFAPSGPAPAAPGAKLTWKDYGDQVYRSALQSGASIASGVSWIQHQINSDPEYKTYADGVKDWASRHAEATLDGMSDRAKQVLSANLFGGAQRDAEGNVIPSANDVGWSGYLTMHALSMVPDGLAMLLPGAILGRVAIKGLELMGVAARGAEGLTRAGEVAQAVGHAAGTGGYFSVENGGELANTIATEVGNAKDADLQQGSAFYQHLRQQGVPIDDAKRQLIDQSSTMVAGGFAAGFAGGAGFGVLGRGAVRGAIAGAASMGIQGGATSALQQGAEKSAGLRTDYDLGSILADTLSQGAMGAVMGAIGGRKGREPPPRPGVDPDVDQAFRIYDEPAGPPQPPGKGLTIYGEQPGPPAPPQGQLDLGTAPAGRVAASPQGEMFPTAQEANAPAAQGSVPLTQQPAPTPPPGPVNTRAGGMPGAVQEGLPINQTPPVIVPTTGQGEMFPSLPEANPPVPGATTPYAGERGAAAAPGGARATPAAPAAGVRPSGTMKKVELDDALKTMGVDTKGMSRDDMARRFDRESARSTAAPADTTVVAPASETLARQGPSERAAPPVSGEALTPPAAPEGVRYTTEKGSTYQVHDDGTTTRDKAARPEHPGEQGPQPRSERTVYVANKDTQRFALPQDAKARIVEHPDGSFSVASQNPDGNWGAPPSARNIKVYNTPAVGLHPIELWGRGEDVHGLPAYERVHLGNKITELTGREPAPVVRPEGGPAPDQRSPAQETAGTRASVPFMVTAAMKRDLAARGHSADDIRNMTPQQAHDILAKPAEVPVERGVPPKAEAAVTASKAKGRPKKAAEAPVEKPVEQPAATAAEAQAPAVDVSNAREDALEKLANVRRAIPVKRGTPVEDLVNRAFAEIQREIGKSDGTPASLMEIIQRTIKPRDTDVAGAATARRGVASRYYKELTGKELRVRSDLAGGVRTGEATPSEIEQVHAEEEAQHAGEAKQPAAAEAIEETATKEAAKMEPVERTVPKGTDIVERAKAIVDKLLDPSDPMDAKAAEAAYNKLSKTGRPRRKGYETIVDALHTELARVTKPGEEARLRDELARNDQAPMHTREGTEARALEEERRDTQSEKLTRKLEDYAPERVGKLIGHIKELSDPVGDAVAKRAELAATMAKRTGDLPIQTMRTARTDGIPPASSEHIKAVQDPVLNKHLMDRVDSAELNGGTASLHGMLDAIINHAATRQSMRPLWEMARKLRAMVGDMPVVSADNAMARGWLPASQHAELFDSGRQVAGYHTLGRAGQAPEHIVLNPALPMHTEALVHETLHAATSRLINRMMEVDPNHRDIQVLRAIGRELRDQIEKTITSPDYLRFHPQLEAFAKAALADPHEIHAWLMTNPVLQDFAARTEASPEFRAEMARLGYGPRPAGRSTWRYFTDWVRRVTGYSKSESGSETTFLDHILRPLQDITEHGARYNERDMLPTDPVLRAHAEPVYRTLSLSMGPRARETLDRIDPAGMGDRMRRAILVSTNRDAIVDWNKDILPSLARWRISDENIRAASNEMAGRYGDRVQEMNGRLNKADNKNTLSDLMVDVGIHESHIGANLPADANAHLTTAEQLAGLRADQAKYNSLSSKDKAIYNDAKKLYNDMYSDERKAQAEGILNGFMPEATQAQRDAFTTDVKSKAALDRFLADPDNSAIARAFGPDWENKRSIATNMARLHGMGFVQGDYFPLRRFGNYVVRYGDQHDPANYGVEMFDSYTKAQERRAELLRQGRTDVFQVARKDDTHLGDITSRPAFADELASAMTRSGLDAAHVQHVTDMMNDILLRHATQSEAARARLRRRGVKGASTDQTRVLSAEFLSKQTRYGYLLHGMDRARRLNEVYDEARAHEGPSGIPGAAVRAMSVYQEIAKRTVKPQEHDNLLRKVGATANGLSFVQNLMSVSHMLTSTMETHGNSLAIIGARHGYTRTALALTRALKDASPSLVGGAKNTIKALGNRLKTSDWNLVKAVVDEMASKPGADRQLLTSLGNELVRTGLVDHTILQDIRQQMSAAGNIGTGAQKVWNMFYNSNAAMAHAVDVMNKLAVAKAAAELEMRKPGATRAQALDYAIQTTRRVMPNYTTGNRERLASNPVMGTLLQFKRYGMHMYALMGNLARESVHGPNKWESRKALAGILATHSAMAGALTLIADPLRYIGGAYDVMSGRATTSGFHDYQNDVRTFLADTFGPEVGELISRGLPHALGFDTHRRTGLANLLEIPEMDGLNKKGAMQVLLGLTTGAAGETLQNLVDGTAKFINGDLGGAFKDMAPRPFRDVFKGIDIATNGIKDSTGKVILPPEKIGTAAGVTQALGFQPAVVSEFREGRQAVREATMEQQADRKQLTDRWLAAAPEDRAAIQSEINQWNADPHNIGARIQRDQLLKTLHQRQKDAKQTGGYGLRLPSKGARQLIQAGAFANAPQ